MRTFEIQLLGCGAALPAHNRLPSAQVLNCNEDLYLIDCGEGTQFQLSKYNIRRSRIQHIFISHLHGDHVFGLPGLITSYNLMGRKIPLHVYGPTGIDEMISHILSYSSSGLNFELSFHPISDFNGKIIFQNEHLRVKSLPLKHKIPTSGYLFEEIHKRKKLNMERIHQMSIPQDQWKNIENGDDIRLQDGQLILNSDLTFLNQHNRKYAYCSDTMYTEELVPFLTNIDLLYHETTYLEDLKIKAMENGHSTAIEAATIAKKSNAKALLTGHYSSRYEHLDGFETECNSVFENVIIGQEGMIVKI